MEESSLVRLLANKLEVKMDLLEGLNCDELDFILYHNRPRKYFEFTGYKSRPRILLKRDLIKDYFVTTHENSARYRGKIWNGRLRLTPRQFNNYVSQKKLSHFSKVN